MAFSYDFIFNLSVIPFKGMVHLIYKLYLKAVFLCIKFNGDIGFSENNFFFT